ncbi:MAG TPA: histidine phosphatase family protein [Thermomicrobiales bacterium]|nr:histidine phosphatase family protein [Thermomicrobiales bacterium]
MQHEEPLASRILLVRHAMTVVDAGRSSREWDLEEGAWRDVLSLAAHLGPFNVDGIITSPERKAVATAGIIATELRLPVVADPALHEQGGEAVPWIRSERVFREAVARHFAWPTGVVLGNESSDDAVKRFGAGVQRARARYRFPLLVGHGRVMSGFIARIADTEPMEVWDARCVRCGVPEQDMATYWREGNAMTTSARLAAAISSGMIPAIVAFVVLIVADSSVNAAIVAALIIWIGLAAAMWVRFGRRGHV